MKIGAMALLGVSVALALASAFAFAMGLSQLEAPSPLNSAIGALSAQAPAGYIGSSACARCHASQSKAWAASQHSRAMSVATPETVRAQFSGQTIAQAGSFGRFYRQDGQFLVETEGRDGKRQTFEVSHTFGLEPLQQYLVRFPDGRLQVLPWAWDTSAKDQGGQRWFHVYGDQAIPPGDPLHWTGREQTWNYMCAECHSTALQKNYDAASNTYHTSFSEISIGCESCHGAGAGHLSWAATSPRADDPRKGFANAPPRRPEADWTPDPATGSPAKGVARPKGDEVELCARCHSRRGTISEDWKPGRELAQTHMAAFLTKGLFEADGQMRDEVFNDQSFKQSRMYARGVTCGDCHDPHSGKLKAAGSEVCAQCHQPEKFADARHTGHSNSAAAPDCIACHMPARTYMVIDRRHDHSFRVPRPDLTAKLGTPNTCNACHTEKSAPWAAAAIEKWHGPQRKGFQTYAEAFQSARDGDPAARDRLIAVAEDLTAPAVARGTALVELAAFPSNATSNVIHARLADDDPIVRIAAARDLATQPPGIRLSWATPLIDDPVRAVRLETGRVLADAPIDQLPQSQRGALDRLFSETESILRLDEDRPEGRANLATFLIRRHRFAEAEAELFAGLRLDPKASELAVNLADLYRATERDDLAMQTLKDAIALAPENAAAHHALGLALVRKKLYPEALDQLALGSKLAPDDARFAYVYGVALKSLGRREDSRNIIGRALEQHPWDASLLDAMLAETLESGDVESAAPLAKRLTALRPDDPSLARMAAKLSGK